MDIHRDQYVPDPGLIGKSATLGSVGYEDNHDQSGGGMFSMFTNFSYFVDFMALGSCIYQIYLLFIMEIFFPPTLIQDCLKFFFENWL